MLWFEKPFLSILRHEYARAMRFTEDEVGDVMPAAPAQPKKVANGETRDEWEEF